jgi:hypothetical protein
MLITAGHELRLTYGTPHATLQQNRPGIAVRAAVPDTATGTVTVHLTQAVPVTTAVALFVVN